MTRAVAQISTAPAHLNTFAHLAYQFVRGHVDAVVALTRVVRGRHRSGKQDDGSMQGW